MKIKVYKPAEYDIIYISGKQTGRTKRVETGQRVEILFISNEYNLNLFMEIIMKNFFALILLVASLNSFGTELNPNGCDAGGYNSDGISCERAADDAQWDADQTEFDQPNE